MTVTATGFALFLDVRDLAARRHLAVAANHAAACERREAEKSNQTHHRLRKQFSNMRTRTIDSFDAYAITDHTRKMSWGRTRDGVDSIPGPSTVFRSLEIETLLWI